MTVELAPSEKQTLLRQVGKLEKDLSQAETSAVHWADLAANLHNKLNEQEAARSGIVSIEQALLDRLKALLGHVGQQGHCRGCHHLIWWVLHQNGKRAPYDVDGLNHFASCTSAKEFRHEPSGT
jgi:hypothetical protein